MLDSSDVASISLLQPGEGDTSTRTWLASIHPQLSGLLPPNRFPALLTDDLTGPGGAPIDVYDHFHLHPRLLSRPLLHLAGLMDTAQSSGGDAAVDPPPPMWPGFEQVWIPTGDGVELSGRLGLATENLQVKRADAIVVLSGLLGDVGIQRIEQLSVGLRLAGFHVLALELRGAGQTEKRFPQVPYTFGIKEGRDLMKVSEWLEDRREVERTGLVAFCIGASHALTGLWEAGHPPATVPASYGNQNQGGVSRRPHFEAGVIALSTNLEPRDILEKTDTSWNILTDPYLDGLQKGIEDRMVYKGYPSPDGSLRRLVEFELARSGLDVPTMMKRALSDLDLLPDKGEVSKLAEVDVPVLLVHAANDPVTPAQDVATLVSVTTNPHLAAVILPGGGHVGFPAYARAYYYQLILAFFDPHLGVAGVRRGPYSAPRSF